MSAFDPKRTFQPSQTPSEHRDPLLPSRVRASGATMRRREFITLVGSAAVFWPLAARAQQAEKVPRVGFLGPQSRTASPMVDYYQAFSSQLEKNGFREGQNIIIEYRATDDPRGPFVGAAELMRTQPDLLVAA